MASLLTIYLWSIVILSWLSSLLYIFFPGETMKYFGGTPTASGEFWVQVVASGDIVIGFLALVGLKTHNNEVLKLVLQAIAVYNIFHMSTFWYDHVFRKAHPYGPAFYIILLVTSIIACGWWGWWKPHQVIRTNYLCKTLEIATSMAHFTFNLALFLIDSGPKSLQAITFDGSFASYFPIQNLVALDTSNKN